MLQSNMQIESIYILIFLTLLSYTKYGVGTVSTFKNKTIFFNYYVYSINDSKEGKKIDYD